MQYSSTSSTHSGSSEDLLIWVTDDVDYDVGEAVPHSLESGPIGRNDLPDTIELEATSQFTIECDTPMDIVWSTSSYHSSTVNGGSGILSFAIPNSDAIDQVTNQAHVNVPSSSNNVDDFIELDLYCPPTAVPMHTHWENVEPISDFFPGLFPGEVTRSPIYSPLDVEEIPNNSLSPSSSLPSTSNRYCPMVTSETVHNHQIVDQWISRLSCVNPPSDNNSLSVTMARKATSSPRSSSSSSPPSTCSFVNQSDALNSIDRLSAAAAINRDPPCTSAFTDCSRSLMLLQANQLAAGSSLTCTAVNILRSLGLLDCCGLEDLCSSLYGLQTTEFGCPDSPIEPTQLSTDTSNYPGTSYPTKACVTRSSSFTSSTLLAPRRLTIPRDNCNNNEMVARSNLVGQQTRQWKRRSPSPLYLSDACQPHRVGSLVSYLLGCSHLGSTSPLISSPHHLASLLPHHDISNNRNHSNGSRSNWRCGRPDYLVQLLTSGPPAMKTSRSMLSRLLTGRFLSSAVWQSLWPATNYSASECNQTTAEQQLSEWLFAWMHRGAVPVLAQLDNEQSSIESCVRTANDSTSSTPSPIKSVSSNLAWRHRVVFGISGDAVFISNPVETAPLSTVLQWLSQQPNIRVDKHMLADIWLNNHHLGSDPGDYQTITDSLYQPFEFSASDAACCDDDFSLLADQPDPRWASMNILGQLLSTLRSLEQAPLQLETQLQSISTRGSGSQVFSGTARPHQPSDPSSLNGASTSRAFSVEQSSLSPCITIPCSQTPGFTLFVPKADGQLVNALFS